MTKKIDIHSNNETACIADCFIPCKNGKILNYMEEIRKNPQEYRFAA